MRTSKRLTQHRYDDLVQDIIGVLRKHKMELGIPLNIKIEHSPEVHGVNISFHAYHIEEIQLND